MKKLSPLLFVFAISCGVIEMAPRKKEMFEVVQPQLQHNNALGFEEVSIEQLHNTQADSTFLIAWAPWCVYSLDLLDDLQYYEDTDAMERLTMVCTSYDIKAIQRVMKRRPTLLPYAKNILNGTIHGALEVDRISAISEFAVGESFTSVPLIYFKTADGYKVVKKAFMYEVLDGYVQRE